MVMTCEGSPPLMALQSSFRGVLHSQLHHVEPGLLSRSRSRGVFAPCIIHQQADKSVCDSGNLPDVDDMMCN